MHGDIMDLRGMEGKGRETRERERRRRHAGGGEICRKCRRFSIKEAKGREGKQVM